MPLYFAYGSNLDEAQMLSRCPSARVVGRAVLHDFGLTFQGASQRWGGAVANVVCAPGLHVPGVLYEITAADLARLDQFEGHPNVYRRSTMVVVDETGTSRNAAVYTKPFAPARPAAPEYLRVLKRAYKRWAFDPKALTAFAAWDRERYERKWRTLGRAHMKARKARENPIGSRQGVWLGLGVLGALTAIVIPIVSAKTDEILDARRK